MSSKILSVIQEALSGDSGLRLMVLRGEFCPLGRLPGAEFKFTANGTPMFRGNLKCECKIVPENGEAFTKTINMPLIAFSDQADELAEAEEGMGATIVADYDVTKMKDSNNWWTQARVIYTELD